MANNYNDYANVYTTFYQIVKTRKENINDTTNGIDIVGDRLIITDKGELYFDFSDNERIKISGGSGLSECYKFNKIFSDYVTDGEEVLDNEIQLTFNQGLNTDIKTLNDEVVTGPSIYSLVFDSKGNIGLITSINKLDNNCTVHILTNNLVASDLEQLYIKRYE